MTSEGIHHHEWQPSLALLDPFVSFSVFFLATGGIAESSFKCH